MADVKEPESGTRETILQLIIERGPITAANLAQLLYLTPAAVRRHIGVLEEERHAGDDRVVAALHRPGASELVHVARAHESGLERVACPGMFVDQFGQSTKSVCLAP